MPVLINNGTAIENNKADTYWAATWTALPLQHSVYNSHRVLHVIIYVETKRSRPKAPFTPGPHRVALSRVPSTPNLRCAYAGLRINTPRDARGTRDGRKKNKPV